MGMGADAPGTGGIGRPLEMPLPLVATLVPSIGLVLAGLVGGGQLAISDLHGIDSPTCR